MRNTDVQLGLPNILYTGAQAAIEGLTVVEGATAYATDLNAPGWYNGATWDWGQIGSGANTQVAYWTAGNTLDGDAGFTFIVGTGALTAGHHYVPDAGTFGIAGNELLTVNAAGNFTFSGVSSVVVPDGTWIGADAACSWVFDSSNGDVTTLDNIGVGTTTPLTVASYTYADGKHLNVYDNTDRARISIQGKAGGAGFNFVDLGGGVNDKWMTFLTDGGITKWQSLNDNASGRVDNIMLMDMGTGNVGISIAGPAARMHIDNDGAIAQPVLTLDQGDISEEYINFVSAATGAGDPIDTVTAVGAAYGRARVAVGGVFKYLQLYDA